MARATLAAAAAFAWASTRASAEADACGWLEEYSIRLCTSSRALRTCNSTWIVAPGVNTTCGWREDCQRCVPPPEALQSADCVLDSLVFGGDGSCPSPLDTSFCENCNVIIAQEVCLGLCAHHCTWSNISWMEGEFCSLRDPPPEVTDNTLIIIIMVAGGALGFIALCIGVRLVGKMRKKALEAQVAELHKRVATAKGQGAAVRTSQEGLDSKRFSDGGPGKKRLSDATGSEGMVSQRISEKRGSLHGVSPDMLQKRGSLHGVSPDTETQGAMGAMVRPEMLKKKYEEGKAGKKSKKGRAGSTSAAPSAAIDDGASGASSDSTDEFIEKYMKEEEEHEREEAKETKSASGNGGKIKSGRSSNSKGSRSSKKGKKSKAAQDESDDDKADSDEDDDD